MEQKVEDYIKMAEEFTSCSICTEAYDLVTRLPKSLDCRHSLCAVCLTSQLESQDWCPLCRQPIQSPGNVANDFTMIDYLERQREQIRKQEHDLMKKKLHTLMNMIQHSQEKTEDIINQLKSSNMENIQENSKLFSTFVMYLLKKNLEHCNSEATLTRIVSKYEDKLQRSLHRFQGCLDSIRSLLEKDYISKEAFDNGQAEATRAVQKKYTAESIEDGLWEAQRELLLEQLTDISQETAKSDPNFNTEITRDRSGAEPWQIGIAVTIGLLIGLLSVIIRPVIWSGYSTEQGLNSITETPRQLLDYNNLAVTGKLQSSDIPSGKSGWLWGLAVVGDRHIVTVEGDLGDTRSLCLYEMTESTLTLLDSDLELARARFPRADRHGHIYVPHGAGLAIIRIVDNQHLHIDRILTGGGRLKSVWGVAVVNDTTLCVAGAEQYNNGIYLLDIITDTVLTVLQPPSGLEGETPYQVGSVSGYILVRYGHDLFDTNMVIYTVDEMAGTWLQVDGLKSIFDIAVDPAGHFLVADFKGNTVWVLSMTGEVLARVKSDSPYYMTLSSDNRSLYIGQIIYLGPGGIIITVLQEIR